MRHRIHARSIVTRALDGTCGRMALAGSPAGRTFLRRRLPPTSPGPPRVAAPVAESRSLI
jgi:hypothetical protein